MPEGDPPTEIELKLHLSPEARQVLAEHPLFRDAPAETRHEVTTYFDTPDLALARQGVSLRVRRLGEERVQTVKLARAPEGAAVTRGEWETPVAGDAPDPAALARTPAAALVPAEARLGPVYVTDITRRVHLLRPDADTLVEAAFGEGTIRAGEAAESVSELELELKQGAPAALYRIGLELAAAAPVGIGTESKAARGLRLRTGAAPGAYTAEDVTLDAAQPAAAALRRVTGAALGHLLANLPSVRAGDAEGVHQARVAIRRLRAALLLGRPLLEPHAGARFEAGLKELGRVFGQARDLDVFVLQTLPDAAADSPGAAWIALLREAAEAAREAARRDVAAAIADPALTRLTLGLSAWMEEGAREPALLGAPALRDPIGEVAPALLDRLARKVAKRGRHLSHAAPEALHALRKSVKKLRYAVEFAGGLYRHKRVRAYLRACKDLQETLGTVNDAAVTVRQAEELSAAGRPDLAPAVAALAAWSEARGQAARARVPKLWAAFKATRRPWA